MLLSRRTGAAVALVLAACGAGPNAVDPEPLADVTTRVDDADRQTLTLVLDLPGAGSRQKRAVEAWFYEALHQSPFLDIRLDDGTESEHTLLLRGELPAADRPHGALTTTHRRRGGDTTMLTGVRLANAASLIPAIDQLAANTRLALGEPRQSVRANRRSAEALVSPLVGVAEACAQARALVRRRQRLNAKTLLDRAVRRDPTCALALYLSAANLMDLGFAPQAEVCLC